ncbi:nascent polypeptide-associated complex protein [Candidatus Pacearchaeota archaeon]|nr:MAG: nascent polypeptide-associated complex protein [Candidatus Pacearchaeota archaeon]
MFPGLGGLNPKKMQAVMKQMGISQEEISASRVIIEKTDGNSVIIENPSIIKIKMQGQETFQISGDVKESETPIISEEDIKTVMEKTNSSKQQAKQVLEQTKGDLAEAILKLSK